MKEKTFPQNAVIGASGEHLVLSILLKHGFVAGNAPYNTKDYDLVVLHKDGTSSSPIQVKTALYEKTSKKIGPWILGKKNEQPIKNLLFCFVRMNLDSDQNDIYVVDSETVESKAWFIYWSQNPDNDSFKGINFHRIFKRIR